ncbi:hypothetical protein NDU88_012222 [Pleurodeles waltl]|uniref:Uncharacterized protein n=1 Tax=Pleurodeles waltl TaxID=8319 RepID=A0AAV7R413_PLEWA|nr:hypothetical protein NDU88_012222 [Pleurodeles waltl]
MIARLSNLLRDTSAIDNLVHVILLDEEMENQDSADQNQESMIRKIISEKSSNVVQLSVKEASLGKRQYKNVGDEFFTISEYEEGLRGSGGNCFKKRKHIEASYKKNGILRDSVREGVQSGTHERQFNNANNRSSDDNDARDDNSNMDEYALDLSYDANIDEEFGSLLDDQSKLRKTLKDLMGDKLFDPRDIHLKGKD